MPSRHREICQRQVRVAGAAHDTRHFIDVESGARPRLTGNLIAGNGAEGVRGLAARSPLLEGNVFEAFGKSNVLGATGRARSGDTR